MGQKGTGKDFDDYIMRRRSPKTRTTYAWGIKSVLGDMDPDDFFSLASQDRKKAEAQLLDYIYSRRGKVAGITIRNPIKALKSFVDWVNDERESEAEKAHLNWKRILFECPKGKKHAADRYPTIEQTREVLRIADEKMKAVILLLASSGIRVGAFDYLKMKDVEFQKNGLLRLTVYSGEDEEYECFASTEAADALKKYIESRELAGETINDESPVIRDSWSYRNLILRKGVKKKGKRNPPLASTSKGIRNQMGVLWIRAKVRKPQRTLGRTRQSFQQVHGWRKAFKTLFPASACEVHGQLDAEMLMGHVTSYDKSDMRHLEEVYLRALPALLVDEKYSLREQSKKLEADYATKDARTRSDLLESKEVIRTLQERIEELESRPGLTREEIRKMWEEEFKKAAERVSSQSP
jgi:site-specific recombinase XerD